MGVALVGMVERNNTSAATTHENHTLANESLEINETVKQYRLNVDGEDYKAHGFLNALMLTPPVSINTLIIKNSK